MLPSMVTLEIASSLQFLAITLKQYQLVEVLISTLRPLPYEFCPFEILQLLRNFFVIKYFPLTAMLNYLTYQVFYIEKNAAFEI